MPTKEEQIRYTTKQNRLNKQRIKKMKEQLNAIMLAGTGSDVGKSLLATGLCRIFLQDGFHPAPFKAQNMALNSYATPDGYEIGRAQAVQAEAAGIACQTDMNPLLLKPSGEKTSQVVLHGKPIGNRNAYDYFKHEGREYLRQEVNDAYDRLAAQYNPIVMEGAGSISELNLRDSDLVNMSMASHAHAHVILVADIDRGGVFASVYGSVMLQQPDDRKRIKGIIINKFRGDLRLFESGRTMIEQLCGVPVLGIVPYLTDIHIEEEDSVSLALKESRFVEGKINVAVVLLKHISNFTDFDMLEKHPEVHLYYTYSAEDIEKADIVILPGTKSTLSDLYELRRSGLHDAIIKAAKAGKTVMGICGGYQMMGMEVSDPDGVEGSIMSLPGLSLLPVRTILQGEKVTRQIRFTFLDHHEEECMGYEIHMGQTCMEGNGTPVNMLEDGHTDGCAVSPRCLGTYIHGILDNKAVISHLLAPYLHDRQPVAFDYRAYKEEQYNALANRLREYIDMEKLYKIMCNHD